MSILLAMFPLSCAAKQLHAVNEILSIVQTKNGTFILQFPDIILCAIVALNNKKIYSSHYDACILLVLRIYLHISSTFEHKLQNFSQHIAYEHFVEVGQGGGQLQVAGSDRYTIVLAVFFAPTKQ